MQSPLTPELLLRAYASGIFPMPDQFGIIRWYSPDPRCIFEVDKFSPPKRLTRTYRQGIYELRINYDWRGVLMGCADRDTTWIDGQIYHAYTRLHELGYAHTVEAYKDGVLAGGLYGVSLGGAFFGESMFHRQRDASKVCLVHLIERMQSRGYTLLDSQFMTGHLASLGAISIARDEYLSRLQLAVLRPCRFA